jgi:hypothetical protein
MHNLPLPNLFLTTFPELTKFPLNIAAR